MSNKGCISNVTTTDATAATQPSTDQGPTCTDKKNKKDYTLHGIFPPIMDCLDKEELLTKPHISGRQALTQHPTKGDRRKQAILESNQGEKFRRAW